MNDDTKRTREALSLRTFFDDQLDHLQNLVGNLSSHIHEEMQQAEEDKQIVETFVEVSNSKMRAVQGYAHKLRGYVRTLYNHVLQVVDEIPPPINLDLGTFGTDTIINALFVNSNDIDKLFQTNPDVNAFLHAHSKDEAPILYALLTANKSEKSTLGVAMQGDMLIRDVPQQAVNFSAHKIHTPCTSSAELNVALKEYLFTRVVALIKQEMLSHCADQTFNADNSYQSKVNSLANPDVYLDTLISYIENPANLLSINKLHFKLSKMGIKLNDDDQQSANEFDIHELNWRDNIRVVVLQITHTL
ncbi:hypothetical protein BCS42_15905 [Crenothrix sp. D3]|nr:hypothetical protein BCS42_15905 [Crenothrix sp. D3]